MKKRICLWLCLLAFLINMGFVAKADAASFDASKTCSLKLSYTQENIAFSDIEVKIYRVAEYLEDGTYSLTETFADYPVKIHNVSSQKEWKDCAYTLEAYTAADGIAETQLGVTDEVGNVTFENLQTGLYLVAGVRAFTEDVRVSYAPFMIFLPTPEGDEGYTYDMTAKPKSVSVEPNAYYSVIKLWKDSGNSKKRPENISVEILKDGALYETVTLNEENNWSYSWQTSDVESRFAVVEKDVPEGYTVSITEDGTTFTITNEYPPKPKDPPGTGDTSNIWLYILLMNLSGIALVVISVRLKRKSG